ncbi:hypothetical protein HYH03_017594 [Edaphochlamys debaryana]|uniref:Uncharacterized protein n=1 Tax=Edaphochlamys debaryana TaxID=47281 RepID=A0A835XHM6_9CHLO|nr:hypothetical protein HYH03_017594 [Edaphochlamys debaryana]|eukprot:KAG2483540.1 hypothetical protein HYH03_017594 [Edaphochlamys debaryana]
MENPEAERLADARGNGEGAALCEQQLANSSEEPQPLSFQELQIVSESQQGPSCAGPTAMPTFEPDRAPELRPQRQASGDVNNNPSTASTLAEACQAVTPGGPGPPLLAPADATWPQLPTAAAPSPPSPSPTTPRPSASRGTSAAPSRPPTDTTAAHTSPCDSSAPASSGASCSSSAGGDFSSHASFPAQVGPSGVTSGASARAVGSATGACVICVHGLTKSELGFAGMGRSPQPADPAGTLPQLPPGLQLMDGTPLRRPPAAGHHNPRCNDEEESCCQRALECSILCVCCLPFFICCWCTGGDMGFEHSPLGKMRQYIDLLYRYTCRTAR